MIEEKVKAVIRDIPNFPKEGIVFKDITPILEHAELCREITLEMVIQFANLEIDAVMGIESRGFFWGMLLAQELNIPFIPARKKGKLPYKTVSHAYELEYGTAEIEVHQEVIKSGMRVLVHDDLLATGGTAAAAAEIIKKENGVIAGFSFLVILEFLKGKDKLFPYSNCINSIVTY